MPVGWAGPWMAASLRNACLRRVLNQLRERGRGGAGGRGWKVPLVLLMRGPVSCGSPLPRQRLILWYCPVSMLSSFILDFELTRKPACSHCSGSLNFVNMKKTVLWTYSTPTQNKTAINTSVGAIHGSKISSSVRLYVAPT